MVLRYGMLGSRYCQSAILSASLRGTKQSPTIQGSYEWRFTCLMVSLFAKKLLFVLTHRCSED